MRQHITTKQLKELTESQLLKYAEVTKKYCTLSPIKNMPNGDGTFTDMVETARLPHLSIGQMIEFLQENSKNKTDYIDNYFGHQIHGDGKSGYDTSLSIGWSGYDELCDALWEAVKQVIKPSSLRDTMAVHEPISPRANGKP